MNTVESEKKTSTMRGLTIAGLVAIVIFIAWLSVQIVQVAPSAFTSLASLAEGITQYQESLEEDLDADAVVITTNAELVDSGEQIDLSWEAIEAEGTFAITQACVDGVSISVVNEDGVRNIDCGVTYNLGNVSGVTIIANSEENRYTDVPYTVTYTLTDDAAQFSTQSSMFTVVNEDNNDLVVVVEETDEEETEEATPEETTEEAAESNGGGYTYEYEYQIPVSDPNGYVDLQAIFIGVGEISNNRFVATNLEQDSTGAIQFAVKNSGTKTSDDWYYTLTLPDGTVYTSDEQDSLKPNEQATIALELFTESDSTHTFTLAVTTDDDAVKTNNSFSQRVVIVD